MTEVKRLNEAIAALEAQRATLGDSVVDTVLAPLRAKLAELEESGDTQERERKLATVLFADITGSTEMSQGLEPEEVLEIMDGALKRMADPVETHGGRITHFMGDGFMAVFGLPVGREKDASQAVRAGLSILEVARAYGAELEKDRQIGGFDVRVGVSTGLVAFGGFTEAEDTVGGLTVNLAKRLESAAPPGGLLISEHTLTQVRGAFEVVPQQAVQAKGFPEPVPAFLVERAKPRTFRTVSRGVQGVETRMVGREKELQQLQSALDGVVHASRTHLLTITGDAGIGKSRLLYEFDQWRAAQPDPALAFKARASEQVAGIPFGLLRELLAYRFGILHGDPATVARLKLETGLMQFFAEEPEMKAHFVGALLGFEFADSPHLLGVKEDARQMREQALYYLAQFFAAVTQETPAVILLDDIHWSDRPSLEAITHTVSQCPTLRLLVVCLARPRLFESFPDWGQEQAAGEAQATLLRLDPLPKQASYELVAEMLQQVEALPEAFQEQIVSAAEGNPFYLEELVEMAIEQGVIRRDEKIATWRLDRDKLDKLRVPPTLTSVLQARLDSLPFAEKLVLRQASVIGRVFWSAALEALQGTGATPSAELAALARREIIHTHVKSTFSGTEEYAFKHGLMRDVAYEMVLKRNRRAYHGQVAEWLLSATQASGRSGEYTGVIAEHYELAGEWDSAADWYLQAGERAKAQGAPSEARVFFDRALFLLPAEDAERRWQSLLGRDEVLATLGDSEARAEDDAALVALAQELDDDGKLAEAYQHQANALEKLGHYREALATYERALVAARSAGNHRVEALTLGTIALCLARLDRMEAAASTAEAALVHARRLADENILVRNLTNAAVLYLEHGDLARGTQLLDEQIAINHQLGNRLGEAFGLSNLGYIYIQLGLHDTAIDALERSLELATTVGHRRLSAYSRLNLALGHIHHGDPRTAQQVLEECRPSLEALQDRFGQAACQLYAGLAQESCGELDGAGECFGKAVETFGEIGVHGNANDARAGLARCSLARGQLDAARQYTREVWAHLKADGSSAMEFPVLAYLTCADVFEAAGRYKTAYRAIEAGYRELMRRADRVGDAGWRRSFLENVPEHRRLAEQWQQASNA